jgi:hypothetical protein
MRIVLVAVAVMGVLSTGRCERSCAAHEVTYDGPAHPRLRHLYKKTAPPAEPVTTFPRAYPWGYFGARPSNQRVSHRGYYGEYYEWAYRRAY